MIHDNFSAEIFDRTNPLSIFNYSRHLIGNSLRTLLGEEVISHLRKGKGGLGQMVEELFFHYDVNSNREADFAEAKCELKCTPLLKSKTDGSYRIKERLVCTMIDYNEIVNTSFEQSHLLSKCSLMLLLFYLHVSGASIFDYEFLYRVLWQLPEKDLLLIKKDYDAIAEKVRRGEAHLLSEGDTLYLGACRKGQKGDKPQSQPNSSVKANKRAFSLKPAYMRYVLKHVVGSESGSYTNFAGAETSQFELVSTEELTAKTFEEVVLDRFRPFMGLDYLQVCKKLGIEAIQSKSKYADIGALIASNGKSKKLSTAEEFQKSGISVKTVRLRQNGMPKEAMSFKNIDYNEIIENDDWLKSELYEIFTSRFMFVVFKPVADRTISIYNERTKQPEIEPAYVLDKVFFWTMPGEDLRLAEEYWTDIRAAVLANNISADNFWSIADKRNFHVRPKAKNKQDKAVNPNGGLCNKFSYWFNADYVKRIIDSKCDE